MSKIALITGVTGQDGAYLSEFLWNRGYTIHGLLRRSSLPNTARVASFAERPRFHLHDGDVTDAAGLVQIVREVQPDEVYNLAAQSHVRISFDSPDYTANVNALGTLRLLEAIRLNSREKQACFYQASTSELFGQVRETPQSESTPFYPRSPYGVSKLFAHWTVVNYREAYGMFACNGIMFNHESPLRGEHFVSRKIAKAVARICRNLAWERFASRQPLDVSDVQSKLFLGNLDAKRDWGHAADYVEGMWKLLQQPEPFDCVFATGETHSVREFVRLAFGEVGRTIRWEGVGLREKGIDEATGRVLVEIDPQYYRPSDVELLLGNAKLAKEKLDWVPRRTFSDLVREMVEAEMTQSLREPS